MNSLELEKNILKRRIKFYKIYTQAKRNGFENPGGFAFLQSYQLERYRNFFKKMVRYKG